MAKPLETKKPDEKKQGMKMKVSGVFGGNSDALSFQSAAPYLKYRNHQKMEKTRTLK
jgi:hypothetical protein